MSQVATRDKVQRTIYTIYTIYPCVHSNSTKRDVCQSDTRIDRNSLSGLKEIQSLFQMAIALNIGYAIGGLSLILDLGNRLFGSYVRTPIGALTRILLIVVLSFLFVFPLVWVWVDNNSQLAHAFFWFAGIFGYLVALHFVFPYRWGVKRIYVNSDSKRRNLVPGIEFLDLTLSIPSISAAAYGTTILVLSDIHCNTDADLELLGAAIQKLPSEPVDIVMQLGDFGENRTLLPNVISTVGTLHGRLGTYCVLGNHDYEGGRKQQICELLKQHSIVLLENEVRHLSEQQISVIGLSRPWTRDPFPVMNANGFNICLTHSPDNIVHFGQLDIDVGFAGHTHGGKISIPYFGGVLVPSYLGRFMTEGLFRRDDSLLYLTRGIGYFPGRFGNVGEICRITLVNRDVLCKALTKK